MPLLPNDHFELLVENNEEYEYFQHELRVEIEENWFISFVHSEYYQPHQGQPVTDPGPNVGLPLQRSTSLNYTHQKHRGAPNATNSIDASKNIHKQRITTSSSLSSANSAAAVNTNISNSTDIDNQIRAIDVQFDDSNDKNSLPHEAHFPVPSTAGSAADSVGIQIQVLSNAVDAAAAVGRMLQVANASPSKSANERIIFVRLSYF